MSGAPPDTNASLTPTSGTTAVSSTTTTPAPASTGSHFGVTPSGIRLTVCTLTGTSWPEDLILDIGKSNWIEWSRKLTLLALQQGFEPWLDGSLPCPDAFAAPEANFIWKRNDAALRAFIQNHVSASDLHLIQTIPSAHAMFDKLKTQHEQQGAFAQINLLLKGLKIEFSYDKPIRDTVAEARSIYQRIAAMGPIKLDDIFSVILLNGMNKNFGPVQQNVHSLSSNANFTAETIVDRLLEEDNLVRRRVEQGQPANPYSVSSSLLSPTAFAAIASRSRSPRPLCANCKREGHGTDFCISPGGKMAGRTLDEARTAQRAAQPKGSTSRDQEAPRNSRPTHPSAHIAATSTPTASPSGTVFVNGLPYVPDPSWTNSAQDTAQLAELEFPLSSDTP
jgi:gag-polypeptide of LTR copia-type